MSIGMPSKQSGVHIETVLGVRWRTAEGTRAPNGRGGYGGSAVPLSGRGEGMGAIPRSSGWCPGIRTSFKVDITHELLL